LGRLDSEGNIEEVVRSLYNHADHRLLFWAMQQQAIWSIFVEDGLVLPSNKEIKSQLPCSTKAWEASEEEWLLLELSEPLRFSTCLTSLLRGIPVVDPNVGALAVVSLLCAILVHIATHERLAWYEPPLSSKDWIIAILPALHAWEHSWKTQPERTPGPFDKVNGSAIADVIPLLNTAYFHVYTPRLLDRIKRIMKDQMEQETLMPLRQVLESVKPKSEVEREYLLKAATQAVHSFHVWAMLGYPLLGGVVGLDSGFHDGYTGFESGIPPPYRVLWFSLP